MDLQGPRAVPADCGVRLAYLAGGAIREIRNLEKDQVWEGRWKVWFGQAVNTLGTVIDERGPCLLS